MPHAHGKLVRTRIRREISHLLGIEHHHIGIRAGAKDSSVRQPEIARRQTRQSTDGLRKTEQAFVTHVVPQEPCERAIGARVRRVLQECATRRQRFFVGADADPGHFH